MWWYSIFACIAFVTAQFGYQAVPVNNYGAFGGVNSYQPGFGVKASNPFYVPDGKHWNGRGHRHQQRRHWSSRSSERHGWRY